MLPKWIPKIKVADVQQTHICSIRTVHVDGCIYISCIVDIHNNRLFAGKLV